MKAARIAVIVGGHGECEAVPVPIRRIAAEMQPPVAVEILTPIRVHEDRVRKEGELERYVELAARKLGGTGGIFVLLDCDWDNSCPKTDAPPLLARAHRARPNLLISLVLAHREFESWFIAASRSVGGKRGLAMELEFVADPERIRGAKEWLRRQMPRNRPYTETEDQPALTAEFDMQEARRSPSFDKCYRELSTFLPRLV